MEKARKISNALAVILPVSALIFIIAESICNCELLIGSFNDENLFVILFLSSAVFLFISTLLAIKLKSPKDTVKNSVIRFVSTIIIVLFTLIEFYDFKERRYYEFTSPDGKYTAVAEEWIEEYADDYSQGVVMIYERKNALFVTKKDLFFNYSGQRPISSGDYTVSWEENVMVFTAEKQNNEYETIKIEF